jgi:hypothetical protein
MRVGLGALIAAAAAVTTSVTFAVPASAQTPIVAQASSADDSRWTGGAAKDMNSGDPGYWRAYVTNGTDTEVLAGHYGTEREARKAGKAEARARNKGFVDAPECEPPILC